MANPPCMSGDGNPAAMVATMLNTGDGFALCDECIVPWAAGLLNVMTGIDPTPFLVAVSDDGDTGTSPVEAEPVTAAGAEADATPPRPANGRRGRMSAASPEAGTETDPGEVAPGDLATDASPAA